MARNRKPPAFDNVAELMEQLGDIPPQRIRMRPLPGLATEKDVLAAEREPRKRLCELVDGVLVEKIMGSEEGLLAGYLVRRLWAWVEKRKLGVVLGADGMLRLFPGLVRIPDVSFISWEQIQGDRFPKAPIAELTPDLAVEVLSQNNTPKEMERKLREYFQAGTRAVWLIYPDEQTAEVYSSPEDVRRVGETQSLDGGAVLPGFRLPLRQLFASTTRPRSR